jgi:carbamoyl-phosphate synthase large subunit
MNILITAASRRIALIRGFQKALLESAEGGKIVASDADPLSPGLYLTEKHYIVPLSSSPNYKDSIWKICREEKINLIVPTIDEELPFFGKYKNEFSEGGVDVLVSGTRPCEICNDKYLTYQFFLENDIPTPRTWLKAEVPLGNVAYPLFIKPRHGRGSVQAFPVRNEKELLFFLDYVNDPIVQPFLAGREFTIDAFCDRNGRCISIVPRERLWIRAGVCDKGRTVKDKRLMDYGIKIAEKLKIVGPANIQCKINGDEIMFFEVNPRFSGAIQLTMEAGANFPLFATKMFKQASLEPMIGKFKDGITMLSYEESLYI